MVGFVGHQTICDDVAVTGLTMVTGSISKPGIYSGGIPAEEAREWRRIVARLKRIDGLVQRLAAVERTLGLHSGTQFSKGEGSD
jgi:UDP-3-O-[3-hydroxymyristoyl] glucosamine N-acyltransferase